MEISGDDHKELYRSEVRKGVEIFERSFKDIQASQFDAQKAQYEKVMNQSLQIIQAAGGALVNEQIIKMKEKLEQDYKGYLHDPSQENIAKVERDIQNLKDYE